MTHKPDEEIRNSIKKYGKSLPDSERNPNVREDTEYLIVVKQTLILLAIPQEKIKRRISLMLQNVKF